MEAAIEYSLLEAETAMESSLVILRSVMDDIYRVSNCGKDNPSTEDLLIANHSCKVDLRDNYKILTGIETLLSLSLTKVKKANTEIQDQ